jgi:hypothetical protein
MYLAKEYLENEVRERLNEVVLDGLDMVRLIGCGETDSDYYYKYDEGFGARYAKNGSGVYYSSAVSRPLYLKDYLPEDIYRHIEMLRKYNGSERVEDFVFEDLGVEQ